jgi:hypothetical protein
VQAKAIVVPTGEGALSTQVQGVATCNLDLGNIVDQSTVSVTQTRTAEGKTLRYPQTVVLQALVGVAPTSGTDFAHLRLSCVNVTGTLALTVTDVKLSALFITTPHLTTR